MCTLGETHSNVGSGTPRTELVSKGGVNAATNSLGDNVWAT